MSKNKKTFWPYGIMLSLIAITIACVATIIVSLDYPVYMDDFYLSKHREVDKNYNEIQISQAKFEQKYKVEFMNEKVKFGEPANFTFKILPLQNQNLPKFTAEGLITRAYTTEFDKKFSADITNNEIKVPPVILEKKGIWQVKIRISDDMNNTAFYSFDTNVTVI